MKKAFQNMTNSIICSSVIACIIGLIMAISPSMSVKTIGIIVAMYIIAHGIALIVLDVQASKYYVPFDGMLSGILSIVLGIILLGKPDIFTTIFTIAIGVWIVLSSINSIKMALELKNDDSPWFLLLLLGVVDLILGMIVIFNPFAASLSITVFAGIMIIIHSIINIVDMVIIKKDAKKISKAIEKRLKEV